MCDEYLKTSRRTITVFSLVLLVLQRGLFFEPSHHRQVQISLYGSCTCIRLYSCQYLAIFFSVLIIRSCLSNSGRLLLIQSLFCLSFLITSRSILTAAPSKNTQYPPTDYKFYNWSNLHITDQQLGQSNFTNLRLSRTMYTQQNF